MGMLMLAVSIKFTDAGVLRLVSRFLFSDQARALGTCSCILYCKFRSRSRSKSRSDLLCPPHLFRSLCLACRRDVCGVCNTSYGARCGTLPSLTER